MKSKIRVGVLFGGRSAEHDVSLLSARNVLDAIDRSRFDVVPIKVMRNGRWFLEHIEGGGSDAAQSTGRIEIALLPGGGGRLAAIADGSRLIDLPPIDVLFPVLHGPFGEDGSVQGYAEVADVAYVGCGIFGSAAAMDKDVTKRLLKAAGLPVARSRVVHRGEGVSFEALSQELGTPIFVKPVDQGSSVGVSRVGGNGTTLLPALQSAFAHGDRTLIEEFMDAREIECAVLERVDGTLLVSPPGEIVTAKHHDFYSYEAKYIDADGALVQVPADVAPPVAELARHMSAQAFRALGCAGMARVDFFLKPDGQLVVNEVNTIPGFTDISMYAKAIAASGMTYRDLISELIAHALARHSKRRNSAAA